MRIDVVTIFPEFIRQAVGHSIVGRACAAGFATVEPCDLRGFTDDKRRTVDDSPYGGGAGMILKPEPLFRAVESLKSDQTNVVLMSPQGTTYTQQKAKEFSVTSHMIIICGHYEGFDERVREHLIDEDISVGDYVLTGGEIAALAVIDSTVRLLPGVLGNADSLQSESFEENLLEYPQFTRPVNFRGWTVPDVLLSGHHEQVALWRRQQQEHMTRTKRPDLWNKHIVSKK
jgi:tRNA (guanine37-N1)-methyltransferase